MIAKNYLSGWFTFDVLSTFPFGFCLDLYIEDRQDQWGEDLDDNLQIMRLIKLAKIQRIFKMVKLMRFNKIMRKKE